jgi:exodeoxyribonuclease-5
MDDLDNLISGLETKAVKKPHSLDLPPYVLEKIDGFVSYKNPLPGISLDESQENAKNEIIRWINNPHPSRKKLTLGGYAGTGKSTLIRHAEAYLKEIGLSHNVMSFTGKAVSVLRRKGVNACTCHSHIYDLDDKAKVEGKLKFIKKDWIDERVLIVDEASQINVVMDNDMQSYPQTRILYVGDHGQLKPIGEDPNIMENPDIKLETPHRQAMGSNILQYAHAVRTGMTPRYGKCKGVRVSPKADFYDKLEDPKWDQIIVGFNKTRHFVNSRIREIRQHYGTTPDPGEKIIMLNNNQELGLFNGMIVTIEHAMRDGNGFIICDLVDTDDPDESNRKKWKNVALIEDQFGKPKLEIRGWIANAVLNQNAMLADYANAITAHKAQGSEWDNILALEECHPDWELKRWSYTVITRAAQFIDYCYAPTYRVIVPPDMDN